MPIDGRQQPEDHLGTQEARAVFVGPEGSLQEVHDLQDSRATIDLVFEVGRRRRGLAQVLLGKTQPPGFVR